MSDQLCSKVALSVNARGLITSSPNRAMATSHNANVSQCSGNSLTAWFQAKRRHDAPSSCLNGCFIASRKPLAMKKKVTPAQVISSNEVAPT